MGTLRYGTCSWSDKAWVGPFYPAGMKPAEYLRHYATHFDTVETDSTYYASPPAERVRRWAEDTPPGFVVSSKLPRDCFLGGDAREMDPGLVLHTPAFEESLQRHAAVMQHLGAKRGPTVVQCPWFQPGYFRDLHDFLGRLEPFLQAAAGLAPLAVEVRNPEFLHEELLAVLRRHRAALALVEVRGMPHPVEVAERLDVRTAPFFYARLIGDRQAIERKTRTLDRVVVDKSESLGRWAHLLAVHAASADGFVYANNHFAGFGPATAKELRGLIEGAA
ncbi:MAG TPA: DUF72 domain-containing protein [Planctomycetota bacterium]|nr:DUF72 domain-containing protein [Planctomycetota bacterium]